MTRAISPEATKFFKRRRVPVGQCLNHCPLFGKMKSAGLDPSEFQLCQGPLMIDTVRGELDKPMLHCWIESDGDVVDLTRKERFFGKADYYAKYGAVVDEIKRYGIADIYRLGLDAGGQWLFWEFDTSKYYVSMS